MLCTTFLVLAAPITHKKVLRTKVQVSRRFRAFSKTLARRLWQDPKRPKTCVLYFAAQTFHYANFL